MTSASGVFGQNPPGKGVMGSGTTGVYGESTSGTQTAGVTGYSNVAYGNGVIGEANNGIQAYGVWGKSTSGYAGYFTGNVHVTGLLSKAGGSFKIDHPLDPANKYLSHSFVESPDMKNIYDGVATTDGAGNACIDLPEWFGALNRDFRYQLTVVDPSMFALVRVSREIENNRFCIASNVPGIKVSWQVTGIRQDAWAQAHRIPVEQDKVEIEQGRYLHPELFGQPAESGMDLIKDRPAPPAAPAPGAD